MTIESAPAALPNVDTNLFRLEQIELVWLHKLRNDERRASGSIECCNSSKYMIDAQLVRRTCDANSILSFEKVEEGEK